MGWRAEIEEIHRRRKLAEACGGADAVAKHHAAGKLTVRERIAALLDPGTLPGSRQARRAARTYDKSGAS